MSDLLHRSQKVVALASDLSLPKWERLKQGLEALSGLELTGISPDVRESFETTLVDINDLLAEYNFSEFEDYRRMSDDDAQDGLDILHAAASRAIEGESDRIIAELAIDERKFPLQAILEAREHRDVMTPRLIRELREVTAEAREGRLPKGNAHFFALFLLSEFNATSALPAIIEVMSLPDELPFDLFNDAVTSTLPRILAQFAADAPEVLDALIANPQLNEFVRWEAAQAYVHLVRDERLSRGDAVRRLQSQLRRALDQEDAEVISPLVCILTDLAGVEALANVTEAFDRDLVDTSMVDKQDFDESIARGDEGLREHLAHCEPTGIPDTIEELRKWASFREVPEKKPAPKPPFAPAPRAASAPSLPPLPSFSPTSRLGDLRTAEPLESRLRVGRNDPCPCGSGKKFKKCCGSRVG